MQSWNFCVFHSPISGYVPGLSYYSVMSRINLWGVWLERPALKWSQFNLQCRLEGQEEVQEGELNGRRLWRLDIRLCERSRQSHICWASPGSIGTGKLKALAPVHTWVYFLRSVTIKHATTVKKVCFLLAGFLYSPLILLERCTFSKHDTKI